MTRAKGLVLFPGAGSSSEHSSLIAIDNAMSPLPVGRFDFPYRRAGKRPPDKAPVLLRCVHEEVSAFAKRNKTRTSSLVIGGRSMGGRMCSLAAAGDTGVAGAIGKKLNVRGLVLISYPLHPPTKPENLRVDHLSRIAVPTLFIHGTKDPFGSPAEIKKYAKRIDADVAFHFIENGRHDLKGADDPIAAVVHEWVTSLR